MGPVLKVVIGVLLVLFLAGMVYGLGQYLLGAALALLGVLTALTLTLRWLFGVGARGASALPSGERRTERRREKSADKDLRKMEKRLRNR